MPRIDMSNKEAVLRAIDHGEPFVLTGLAIGPCVGKWSAEYLYAAAASKHLHAGVHVCAHKTVDLAGHRRAGTRKNFKFVEMPFGEFIRRCVPKAFEHLPPLPPVLARELEPTVEPTVKPTAGLEPTVEVTEPLEKVEHECERLYLRSVAPGEQADKMACHIHDVFPELISDIVLPHGELYPPGRSPKP